MDSSFPSNISDLISHLRRSKGLTQKELSEKSGVPERTIQHIEAGGTKKPQKQNLKDLASAFEVDVSVLQAACQTGRAPNTVQAADTQVGNDTTSRAISSAGIEPIVPSRNKQKLILALVSSLLIIACLIFVSYALIINQQTQNKEAKPAITKPIIIAGKVLCAKNEQVINVWVDVFKGSNVDKKISGIATLSNPNSNGSEEEFAYELTGDAYNLHVGCGGSKEHWKGIYRTETGSGAVHDHNFHYFTCHDVPPAIDYGSCELKY